MSHISKKNLEKFRKFIRDANEMELLDLTIEYNSNGNFDFKEEIEQAV